MQCALASLGRIAAKPLPSAMTVAVIGIALALPAGLYLLTVNLAALGGGWERSAAVSVFLRPDVTLEEAGRLAETLRVRPDLEEVSVVTPEAALAQLRAHEGFAEAVEQLEENPLPAVLALRPAAGDHPVPALEGLRAELEGASEVDFVRLDTQWVSRFEALLDLFRQGVLLLGATLALAVLLVVGNTIRLEIENRHEEIAIMGLVGATPAFIRRPFLYSGAWYGLFGAVLAWVLVSLGVGLLQGPVDRLAALYATEMPLSGLGARDLGMLLAAGILLGLAGSWLAVGRHLASSGPE